MHTEAYRFFANALQAVPPRSFVVEIGARNINGTLRQLFGLCPPRYLGVDIAPGHCVDVVANGAEYQPDAAPDTVLCAEVLEHAEVASSICANAYRMLAPGGLFVVSAASDPRAPHSAIDGADLKPGEFYRNVSVAMLTDWLAAFGRVRVSLDSQRGDIYAVAWK